LNGELKRYIKIGETEKEEMQEVEIGRICITDVQSDEFPENYLVHSADIKASHWTRS